MFSIEKATSKDFERVYPLLNKFDTSLFSKEDWKRLFTSYWKSPEEFCGQMIVKDGEVKGFLGLIFSERMIDSKTEKLCNINCWIVDEDCRSQSLFLLLETLKLKNYTFTCFTPAPGVTAILGKLGFAAFEVNQRVLFPIPGFRLLNRKFNCEFDLQKIKSRLNETDRTILEDHQKLDCLHLLLISNENKDAHCYVVLKKTNRRRVPVVKVQYLSNAAVFAESIQKFVPKICRLSKAVGIMVDERYIEGYTFPGSIMLPDTRKAQFKSSSTAITAHHIDTLYTELVVLFHPGIPN